MHDFLVHRQSRTQVSSGQSATRGGGIGDDMQIGRFEIQIAMMLMMAIIIMPTRISMIVMVRPAENQGAHPVHQQTEHGDHDRDRHHQSRAALGGSVAGIKDMVVYPPGQVIGRHD
ncbi:MAG: hypothetical protein A2486_15315 [Burkholderiales bacterium RIFOXYC12_FULL_65_23]|nr:MAG: hypothetical protein A2486_15315 [Burkholderiales bacterium RIFOXYC12_FULL_65_23]